MRGRLAEWPVGNFPAKKCIALLTNTANAPYCAYHGPARETYRVRRDLAGTAIEAGTRQWPVVALSGTSRKGSRDDTSA